MAKFRAAKQAYSMAGITNPEQEIDIAEVYDAFSGAELQSIDALGLCEEGQAGPAMENGEFDAGGRLPVNLSGGLDWARWRSRRDWYRTSGRYVSVTKRKLRVQTSA